MTPLLARRALLRRGLGLLALARGSLWKRPTAATAMPATTLQDRYRDLKDRIELPLEAIADPWRPIHFEAWVRGRDGEAGDVLLKGVLLRTTASTDRSVGRSAGRTTDAERAAGVQALCVLCPHEICNVEYVTHPAQVRLENGPTPNRPLLVCPCHFSVFDPLTDGARISGPAFRGLYRFKAEVRRDTVRITQVEESVLALLGAPAPPRTSARPGRNEA